MCRSYDSCLFQLVHQSSRTVVANGELALYKRGAALLGGDDDACCLAEQLVKDAEVLGIVRPSVLRHYRLGQFKRSVVANLLVYEVVYGNALWGVYKCALHADGRS